MHQADTDTAALTDEERWAANTGRLLEQIEMARYLRHQALAMLRLVRCVLTDPDAQQRGVAAQRLSRASGRPRSGVVAMLVATIDLPESGIRIENHAVELLNQYVPQL